MSPTDEEGVAQRLKSDNSVTTPDSLRTNLFGLKVSFLLEFFVPLGLTSYSSLT